MEKTLTCCDRKRAEPNSHLYFSIESKEENLNPFTCASATRPWRIHSPRDSNIFLPTEKRKRIFSMARSFVQTDLLKQPKFNARHWPDFFGANNTIISMLKNG